MTWLIAVTALCFLPYVAVRFWQRNRYVQERSPAHQAMIDALEDWLATPEVREALYRSMRTRGRYLAEFRLRMGSMSKERLGAAMAALLKDRHVRMMVAKHMSKDGRASKAETMRELRKLAGLEA